MTEIKDDLIDEEIEEETSEEVEEEEAEQEETNDETSDETNDETSEETAQTIAEYQSKIDILDEQLAEFHAERVGGMRFEALIDANYTEEQAERYVGLIDGNTADEITESIETFKEDIPPPKNYVHQSMMGSGRKPVANNYKRSYQKGADMARKLIRGGKIK